MSALAGRKALASIVKGQRVEETGCHRALPILGPQFVGHHRKPRGISNDPVPKTEGPGMHEAPRGAAGQRPQGRQRLSSLKLADAAGRGPKSQIHELLTT